MIFHSPAIRRYTSVVFHRANTVSVDPESFPYWTKLKLRRATSPCGRILGAIIS
jgi:hypothetical protein